MTSIPFSPTGGRSIENLDEFDEPASLRTTYCQRMTVEEFENQASQETEKALADLMEYLDNNNDTYMNILKKRKQEEIENSGFLSFIKAKVLSTIQGENYTGNQVDAMEFMWKKDELKNGIARAFDYAQEAKGRRTSKRLAARKEAQNKENTPIRGRRPLRRSSQSKIPVAPPPPPIVPQTTKVGTPVAPPPPKIGTPMGPPLPPPLPSMVTPLKDRNSLANTPVSMGRTLVKRKWEGSSTSLASVSSMDSIHSEILAGNPLQRLKSTKATRSPGGTPSSSRHKAGSLSNDNSLEKVFLSVMQQKFRNIRSPSPANEGRQSVQSPGGFSPYSP